MFISIIYIVFYCNVLLQTWWNVTYGTFSFLKSEKPEMHLTLPAPDKETLEPYSSALPSPNVSSALKKKSHQTFVQLFYSRLWWITPVTRTENFPQLKKNSTPFSMWSPMSKPSLRLPGIFRNLDFISHLGWRITIQPKPQSWHLPLDYALVLSTIRVEWVNNEKQLTLLFIRSSIVLLVIWLASMFISVRHSSEQQAQILFALVWLCQ